MSEVEGRAEDSWQSRRLDVPFGKVSTSMGRGSSGVSRRGVDPCQASDEVEIGFTPNGHSARGGGIVSRDEVELTKDVEGMTRLRDKCS